MSSSPFLAASNALRVLTAASAIVLACSPGDRGADEPPSEPIAVQQAALDSPACNPSDPFGPITSVISGDPPADGLTLSEDELTAYVSNKTGSGDYDIYVTTRPDKDAPFGALSTVVIGGATIDRAPSLSENGLNLYFWRKVAPWASSDIFVASRSTLADPFGAPVAVPGLNSGNADEDPFFVSGGSVVYFVSDRPGGDRDLWKSVLIDGSWSTPAKLLDLNTASDQEEERRPILTSDGLTIYFHKDGGNGPDGDTDGDIFIAHRSSTAANFGNPELLDAGPINTTARDFPVALSKDGCTLYFANNLATQGGGTQDPFRLYRATRGETSGPPAHCSNGVQDFDETGVDSGGSCPSAPTDTCASDANCAEGLLCTNGWCGPPDCRVSPVQTGCGSEDAPCGPNCTTNPLCNGDADCPSGLVCPPDNGWRYGRPGWRVCELPGCGTQAESLGCGFATSTCGLCPGCTPSCTGKQCGDADLDDGCGGRCTSLCAAGESCEVNADCQPGALCLLADLQCTGSACSRVCRPTDPCAEPDLAAPDCGTAGAVCGPNCPKPFGTGSCVDRVCGTDPVDGTSCGSCALGQFCTAAGRCASNVAEGPVQVPNGPGPNPPTRPVTPAPSPAAVTIGALPGMFSVTDRGSSSYSIPIAVPPGRAGVQPSIELRYQSGAPNGLLGRGWVLGGTSSISACRRSYALDGRTAPPDNLNPLSGEPYCLDGQRLMLVDAATFEYRTAVDGFAKINAIPAGDGAMFEFRVQTKEGRILTYGGRYSSAIVRGPGGTHTFALSKVADRMGNFMRISYDQVLTEDGFGVELIPRASTYTGHGETDGDREVFFEYEGRVDTQFGWMPGEFRDQRTQRLKSVQVRAQGTLVRRYELGYQVVGRESRLASVQEAVTEARCGTSGAVCRPATTFDYFNDVGFEEGVAIATALSEPGPVGGIQTRISSPFGLVHQWAPSDGWNSRTPVAGLLPAEERRTDRVTSVRGSASIKRPNPAPGPYGMALNLEDSRSAENRQSYVDELEERLDGPEIIERYTSRTWGPLFTQPGGTPYDYLEQERPHPHILVGPTGGESVHTDFTSAKVWFVDLDGDGVQDKLYCTGSYVADGRKLSYKLADARSKPANHHPQVPVDATEADRTGFIDPIFENICGCTPSALGCWAAKAPTLRMDVDGDGTLNVLFHDGEHSWAGLDFSSGTPVWRTDWFDGVGEYLNPDDYHLVPVDVNGDGLRDLLALPEKKLLFTGQGPPTVLPTLEQTYLAINTSRHFELRILEAPADDEDARLNLNSPLYLSDIDQDGVEELLEAGPDPDSIPGVCGDSAVSWSNLFYTNPCAFEPRPWMIRKVEGSTIRRDPVPGLVARRGVTGDFDGDGNQDVLAVGADKQHFTFHRGKGRLHGLLKSVVDGLGRRVDVAYDKKNLAGELVFESGLESFSETSVTDATCRWPYRCAESVDAALVSSHVESHYLNQSHSQSMVDKDFRYKYRGSRRDLAGYGWLGVGRKQISVRDGLGATIEDTTIDYTAPLPWNPATSSIPYVHAHAGMATNKLTVYPLLDSPIAGSEQLSIVTNVQWSSATSTKGRPFPYILSTTTTQLGSWPGISEPSRLYGRRTIYGVDGYGNVTSEIATSYDIDGYEPIPGSETRVETTRSFTPIQSEIDAWLVGLKRSETTTATPRCANAADCEAKRKRRVVTYEYYAGTPLLRWEHREPIGSVELRRDTEYVRGDAFGNVTATVATNGDGDRRETRVEYDARGLFPVAVTQVGEGQLQTTQIRHDDRFGKQTVSVDPNGIDSTWTFDAFGSERHSRGPDGEFFTDYAQTDSYVDSDVVADGLAIASAYSTTTTKSGGAPTTVEFNAFGQMVRRVSAGYQNTEVREEFVYDHRSRLRVKTRPHFPGSATQGFFRYSYDAMNRPLREEHPNGGGVDYFRAIVRHAEQRPGWNVPGAIFGTETLVATAGVLEQDPTPPLVSTQIVDRDERTLRALDPLGKRTDFQYGGFGDVEKVTDAADRVIETQYDGWSRRLSVTDLARGGAETMEYNGFDEVVRVVDAAAREHRIVYDDFGRPVTRTDVGEGVTSWTYDGDGTRPNEVGRLVETLSSSGQRSTHRYEPPQAGFNRGLQNQVTQHLVAPGDPGSTRAFTTDYTFDAASSNLVRMDYPSAFGARVSVAYEYDASGHLVRLADAEDPSRTHWQFVAADEGQRIAEERLGTSQCGDEELGTRTVRTFDPKSGQLKSIATTCNTTNVQSLDYTYDEAGRLETREDAEQVEAFRYDQLSRITHINQQEHYRYDTQGRGRLEFLRSELGERNYTYHQQGRDWIATSGSSTYTHDAVGNVQTRTVNGTTQTFAYTAFDLPESITVNTSITDFAYTSNHVRAVKRSPTRTTFYAGDAFQEVENSDGTRFARSLVYVGRRAVAQITTDASGNFTRRYLHADVLGSVHAVTREDGSVESTRSYTPFGEQRSGNPGIAQVPYGFTGHEEDSEFGLVNMKGRLYDPLIGQFLQADPILATSSGQGLNRFAYVNNSPLNRVDPTGQFSIGDVWDEATRWIGRGFREAGDAVAGALSDAAGWIGDRFSDLADIASDPDNWVALGEGIVRGVVGAALGAATGMLFGGPVFAVIFGIAGGVNGFLGGVRGSYSLDATGTFAFILDSTWGIIGTTLGTLVNVGNAIGGADYAKELSYRQNRQVYHGGFYVKSSAAITFGPVVSNFRHGGRGLLSHETEHVWTNRISGFLYNITYAGWMAGSAIVLTAAAFVGYGWYEGDLLEDIYNTAYLDNPWESHAYCNNNRRALDGRSTWFCN